jgi:four helix bundle protein
MMAEFDHERLKVYQLAIKFVVLVDSAIESLPKGRSYLCGQLQRAASSIVLNIAEGAGEFSKHDKARFYRMALRSATECAAALDICKSLAIGQKDILDSGKNFLVQIVAMLTTMIKNLSVSQGMGKGDGKGK